MRPVTAARRNGRRVPLPLRSRPKVELLEERALLSVEAFPQGTGWSGGQPPALQGSTVLNFTDTGWYDQTGFHDSTNENYLTGRSAGFEYRSFYVFNIPNTPRAIVGAQLRVYNPPEGYLSTDPTELFMLHHVSTPVASLRAGGTGQVARFQDLADGAEYGSRPMSVADNNQIVTINLNAAAVADLNAARGQLFALGGRNASLGAEDGRFFRFSGFPGDPRQLVLDLADPAGPVVIGQASQGAGDVVSSVRITFDRSINPATFTVADITEFTGQLGLIEPTAVTPVMGSNNTQFDVSFPAQSIVGLYGMAIGPNIEDMNGNEMDQNTDGSVGDFDDRYLAIFRIEGARVTAAPSGSLPSPVSSLRISFNRAVDPASMLDWVYVDTPEGRIGITGATAVPGSEGRQVDVTFDPQSTPGNYVYTIGAGVRDVWGNPLDQNRNLIAGELPGDSFVNSFRIVPAGCFNADAVYTSCVAAFENINLEPGQPDVFTIISGCDDCASPVNLAGNTFRFYGSSFTGNNQLFVSSNGLVTFVNSNASFSNTNLTDFPLERTIAPLWDDWIDTVNGMVLGKFEGNRLILEWNRLRGFGGPSANVTFQVILELNTGGTPGDIWINYVDTNANDPFYNDGRGATIGIKDAGTQGPNRILVSFDALSDYVGTGRAILYTTSPGAGPVGGGAGQSLLLDAAVVAALPVAERQVVVEATDVATRLLDVVFTDDLLALHAADLQEVEIAPLASEGLELDAAATLFELRLS